jgi:hypothetical protein
MRYGTVKITRPDWWPGALQQHAMADRFEAAFFTEDDNTISCGWLSILVGREKAKTRPKPETRRERRNKSEGTEVF